MLKYLSSAALTLSVLSASPSAFAQTTLLDLETGKAAVIEQSVQDSPIDYAVYDEIMNKVSVKKGGRPRIAYDLLRDLDEDFFGDYIAFLAQQDVDNLSENDKLSYWLNVQNAVTIHAVMKDGKKKKSLKKLRGTATAPGKLWTKSRGTFAGQEMSLQDIETKLLAFDNPNVIYGIYQGVRGGPCVLPTAYRGTNVNEVLADNAKQYVNSNNIVAVNNSVVEVTPVFLWYYDDAFKGDDKVLLDHLKANAEPNLKSALYRGRSFEASSLNYRLDHYDVNKANQERLASRQAGSRPRSRSSSPPPRQSSGGGGYGS